MINTRIAQKKDMQAVYQLTHDMYVEMEYCKPQPDMMLRHYPHLDNITATTVFVAEENDKIVGTNSLTLDSPVGLHVDEDFPEEVDKVRQACKSTNQVLAASWRIVTYSANRNTLRVVLNIINITMVEIVKQHIDVILFSFNPKHENFYQKMLGLKTIARNGCTTTSAPAILMKGDVPIMIDCWKKVCKRRKMSFLD